MEEIPEPKVPPEPVTRKTVEDYLKIQGLANQITPEETERLVAVAIRHQLNPFLRELHLVITQEKGVRRAVALVGYEVYLRKADQTRKLDGWRTWTEGEGDGLKAVLEIYRHDWAHPFVHEVHFTEAVQRLDDGTPTAFWRRMPKFQLRKVAIAQGFRLAFPEELALPYEPAELSLDDPPVKDAPEPVPKGPAVPQVGPKSAFAELDEYLTANAEAFTAKHYRWIREQLEKTPTLEKARAMLGYARKIVLGGGDSREPAKAPRTYGTRGPRKPELVPEPNF